MAYIGRQLARGENKLFDDISSSFNGSTTTFTLAVSSVANATATPYQLFVSLGGVMQKPNTDFTTAGNQITFTTAPAAGLSCWIMMQGDTIDQAAIPDASVTPSKISGSNFAFSGDLRLKDADGSHYVGFASPTTVSTNKVWTLPAADGTSGQFLKTNGSAVLSWDTVDTSSLMPLSGGIFSGDVTFDGATAGYDIVWDKSDNALEWADNAKAKFGTGGDLEIFHNASNSVINDAGTGDLLLQVGGSTKATVSSTGFDITGALTVSTNATITGNLTVSGTTTTINTQTLDVEDKNVVIGKVSSPSDTTADGGGWTLKGASDKTFNWINATDAWTSSEHIHLIDNKKLFVGGASGTTDGLEIVHNGSNSILNDSGTGTLQLQLGGSTKLEVTSGGINVTGAISVGGSPLASGNSIDLVADGAIAAGKPVVLTTAGKVTSIALQVNAKSNPGNLFRYSNLNSNRTGSWCDAIWHSTTTTGLVVFRNHSDNPDYLRYAQFTYATGGFTAYSDINMYGNQVINTKIVMDPDIDKPNVFWQSDHDGSKIVYSRSVTMNGGGTNVPQASTAGLSTVHSQSLPSGAWDACYDTNANIFVFVFRDDADGGKIKVRLGYQSEPSTGQHKITWMSSTDTFIDNDGEYPRCCFDTANNKVIFAWGSGGGHNVGAAIGTVSGTGSSATISCGSVVTVNTENPRKPVLVFHTDSGQAGFLYQNSSNNLNRLVTLKTSGTTVHYNSATNVGTENSDEQGAWYDSNTKTLRTAVKGRYMWFSSLGTATSGGSGSSAATLGTGSTDLSQSFGGNVGDYRYPRGFNMPYDPHHSSPLLTGVVVANDNDSDRLKLGSITSGEQSSNATDAVKLIGFAESAISDGNTGTIKLHGNVVGNQSSLTVGSQYYIQGDGTIGTSGDNTVGNIKAGTAVSATKLIICDPRV